MNCIEVTNYYQTKLYSFQNPSLRFFLKTFLKFRKFQPFKFRKQASLLVNMNEMFKLTPYSFVFISVKEGSPTLDELEKLSLKVGNSWDGLARRLGFSDEDITGFDEDNREYQKKALKMLFGWKKSNGSDATYKVLHSALCHEFVKRKDLAEAFCCC